MGRESLRQNYQKLFRPWVNFNEVKQSVTKSDFQNISWPNTWEIDIGNSCNLKCIMCNPTLSDKIETEVRQNTQHFRHFPKLLAQANENNTANWLDTESGKHFIAQIKPTLKWLKIQGGEALTVKSVRAMLEELASQDVSLLLTTNGTVLDNRSLEILKKFRRVDISISIEAASPANDVIRYGSDWNTIRHNIMTLKQCSNISIQINHVLQATSVLFLPDVIAFAETNDFHVCLLPVEIHDYLSLKSVPKSHVDNLVQSVGNMQIRHPKNQYISQYLANIRDATEYDQNLHHRLAHYITTLDELRNQKLTPWVLNILPES